MTKFEQLKRREFITLLGGTAMAWPLAARAQQPELPVVGVIDGGSEKQIAILACRPDVMASSTCKSETAAA